MYLIMHQRVWALLGLILGAVLILAAATMARPGLLRTGIIVPSHSPSAASPTATISAQPGADTPCDTLYASCLAQCRTAGNNEEVCATNCEPVLYDPTCLENYGSLEGYAPYREETENTTFEDEIPAEIF